MSATKDPRQALIDAIEKMGPCTIHVEQDEQGRPRVVKLTELPPAVRDVDTILRLNAELREAREQLEATRKEARKLLESINWIDNRLAELTSLRSEVREARVLLLEQLARGEA